MFASPYGPLVYLSLTRPSIFSSQPAGKKNKIEFIDIRQQIIKSTHVKRRNKLNTVCILKGEVGHNEMTLTDASPH